MAGAVAILVWAALLAGVGLVVRGLRGRPEWTSPSCATCGYELRGLDADTTTACPECGSNLRQPRSVRFGRYRRNKKLALAGAVMMLISGGLVSASYLQRLTGLRLDRYRSNESLIARLGTHTRDPRVLEELMTRYYAGKLTDAEIAAAVDQFIAYLQNSASGGGFVGMTISRSLEVWMVDKRISTDQLTRFCKAFYSGSLNVRIPERIRANTPFDLSISGDPMAIRGFDQIFALKGVRLETARSQLNSGDANNGVNLTILPSDRLSRRGAVSSAPVTLSGSRQWGLEGKLTLTTAEEHLPSTPHELVFTLDVAAVESHLASFNAFSPPGTPDQWPQTMYQEVETIRVPVTVIPSDQDVIKLVISPSQKAAMVESLRVSALRHEFSHGMKMYRLIFNPAANPPIPLSCKVFVRCGSFVEEIGSLTAQRGGMGLSGFQSKLDGLPRDAQTVDVIFRPDPKAVESRADWTEIWGEEIVVPNVPIVRPADQIEMDRQAIRSALNVREVRLGGRRGERMQGPSLSMGFSPLPRPVRMRVIIRSGEFEREIGSISGESGHLSKNFPMQPVEDFPADAATADVIFRPDQGSIAAEQWAEYWIEDVVISNVPVVRTRPEDIPG